MGSAIHRFELFPDQQHKVFLSVTQDLARVTKGNCDETTDKILKTAYQTLKAYDKALVPSYIKENTQENEKMITRFNRSFQKSIADKIEFFEVLKDKGKFYDGGEFCCI